MKCLIDIDKVPNKSVERVKTKSSKPLAKKMKIGFGDRETTCSFAKAIQNLNEVTVTENNIEILYFAHV